MKQIVYILISIFLCNCGGIPKYKDTNFKPLTDVRNIEGDYKNFDNDTLKLNHNSINGHINWRRKHIDTTPFSSVNIEVLSEKRLKLDFIRDNDVLKSRILKYRLRHNGFIKLRNGNFRMVGIPYVFGEYDSIKFELGLTENNDLILHGYKDQAGGILIVLSSGRAFSVKKIYKRI